MEYVCNYMLADGDPVAPREHRDTIASLMERHGVRGEAELCAGARHGFVFPERFCYDEAAAEHVWARWLAMLARNLG